MKVNQEHPHTIEATIHKNLVVNETDICEEGEDHCVEFESIKFDGQTPSLMYTWPSSDNPDALYMFGSFRLSFGSDQTVTTI